jgi:hypothetical protein
MAAPKNKTPSADKRAPKKPLAKKPTPKKPAKKKPALTTAQRELLLALDDTFASPIDHPVAETLQESRELEVVIRKLGNELYKKSKLSKKVATSLAARRALLETSEALWTDSRALTLPSDLRALRVQAENLKRDAIAALRHFREDDEAVQRRVDAIILGAGTADLIDDLKKLAVLLEEHSDALTKADLPPHAPKRARAIAEALGGGAAERVMDPDGSTAMELRNRAFWWLREAMDAIRSAGRYVYRGDPKRLILFRASSTRARARTRAATQDKPGSSGPKEEPTPGSSDPTSPSPDPAAAPSIRRARRRSARR